MLQRGMACLSILIGVMTFSVWYAVLFRDQVWWSFLPVADRPLFALLTGLANLLGIALAVAARRVAPRVLPIAGLSLNGVSLTGIWVFALLFLYITYYVRI